MHPANHTFFLSKLWNSNCCASSLYAILLEVSLTNLFVNAAFHFIICLLWRNVSLRFLPRYNSLELCTEWYLLLSYPRFKSVCSPWVMLPSQDCYVYRFNHNYWSSPSIVLIYVVLVLSLSFRETSWSLIQHVYVIYCRINLINLVNLINFRDTTSITLCFVI